MEACFQDKVVLVTGGSRGIGEAAALEFGRRGALVAVASRRLPDLERVANKIREAGGKSVAVASHLGKMRDITNLVNRLKQEFGRIDILLNNAGTSPVLLPILDVEEPLWDTIMGPNLKGLFFLSQSVAKVMKEHGGGKIINVASVDASRPEPGFGIYCISKTAVVMATKVMALEWAQYNIRVNAIAPGQVHTRLRDSGFAAIKGSEEEAIKRTPLRHIASPNEIVGALIYLASSASDYVTGTTLTVDGGFSLT